LGTGDWGLGIGDFFKRANANDSGISTTGQNYGIVLNLMVVLAINPAF
jgi:hypothetical protein